MIRTAIVSLLILFFALAGPVQAQVPGLGGDDAEKAEITVPDPLTPEAVRELVSRLSDDQVRDLLLKRLDAAASATAKD